MPFLHLNFDARKVRFGAMAETEPGDFPPDQEHDTHCQQLDHVHRSLGHRVRGWLLLERGLGLRAAEGRPRGRGDKHGLLGNCLRLVRRWKLLLHGDGDGRGVGGLARVPLCPLQVDVGVHLRRVPVHRGVVTLLRACCRRALGILRDLRGLAADWLAGVRVLALRQTLGSRQGGKGKMFRPRVYLTQL